jgi:hypothetical protein
MEGLVDVITSLIADGEALELAEPGQGPLHDPAVPAQPLAGLDALAGDADHDGAGDNDRGTSPHRLQR